MKATQRRPVPVAPDGLSSSDSSREPASARFSFHAPELEPKEEAGAHPTEECGSATIQRSLCGIGGECQRLTPQEHVGGALPASEVMCFQMRSPSLKGRESRLESREHT